MTETKIIFIRELTRWNDLPAELSEALKTELVSQGFFSGTAFCFVGLYYSVQEDVVIAGFPKYCGVPDTPREKRAILEELSLICRLAARARRVLPSSPVFEDLFQPLISRGSSRDANPYELAVFLMQDYAENGLYMERVRQLRTDGIGHRNWSRTIQRMRPIVDREPLYLKTVTVQSHRSCSDTITPLHAYVIRQCAKLLQPLGMFEQTLLPDDVRTIGPGGDLAQYVPRLNEKMNQTFSERELRLLRALRTWCGLSPYHRVRFGITAFERFWEYAAKEYFGNIAQTGSGAPNYYKLTDPGGYKCFCGAGQAIPDILYAGISRSGSRGLAIFDAKYYTPHWDEKTGNIYGAPANSDIAKQIQYFHSLRQRYSGSAIQFGNAFLFPCPLKGQMYQYAGYAAENHRQRQEILKRFPGSETAASAPDLVLLYLVDPRRLWDACLQGAHISSEEIFEEFIRRFNDVREQI